MKYFIALTSSQHEQDALDRATQVLDDGNSLERVFFLKNAVNIGANTNKLKLWQTLQTRGVELLLCSAAIERRGLSIISDNTFSTGGLGLYAESLIECDQVEHFG